MSKVDRAFARLEHAPRYTHEGRRIRRRMARSVNWTGVYAPLSVAHQPEGGALHGHTYGVTAWFMRGEDALTLRARLLAILAAHFDHRLLPSSLSLGEDLAEAIMAKLIGCVGVDLAREPEGIFVQVRRTDLQQLARRPARHVG